jgi:hypothetical protein
MCSKKQKISDNRFIISHFSDLKVNDIIKLKNNETYYINKIFKDGYVDMTSTKQFNPKLGLDFHEKFFSIMLKEFSIIS